MLAREADGFHGIETLLCRTDLADSLQATTVDTASVTIAVSGADTGPDQKNLAVRAAEMVSLRELTDREFRFEPLASEAERAKRVKAWREWWDDAGAEFLSDS